MSNHVGAFYVRVLGKGYLEGRILGGMGLGHRIINKIQVKAAAVLVVFRRFFALALAGAIIAHDGLIQSVQGIFGEHPCTHRQLATAGRLVKSVHELEMPEPIIWVGPHSRGVQLIIHLRVGIKLAVARGEGIVRLFFLEIHQQHEHLQGVRRLRKRQKTYNKCKENRIQLHRLQFTKKLSLEPKNFCFRLSKRGFRPLALFIPYKGFSRASTTFTSAGSQLTECKSAGASQRAASCSKSSGALPPAIVQK